MAYAPRTGPNLLRRHYPDGAEGLRAFELAKQQKKAITDARYYQRTKAEKTYGIVAPARTSNTAQARNSIARLGSGWELRPRPWDNPGSTLKPRTVNAAAL